MWAGDHLIGMLDVYTKSTRYFKEWEKKFFNELANYAALFIQKAELLGEAEGNYVVLTLEQKGKMLLDGVSHEFRAPIVGIRSNASLLQRRIKELPGHLINKKFGDILTDCEILLFQVGTLEHILGRTSPISKIERTLIFRDVIIKTISQLRPLITEQGFDISKVEYDRADIRKISPLYVNKTKLNQVVYNLLTNAIKYAENDPDKFAIRIDVDKTRDNFIINH